MSIRHIIRDQIHRTVGSGEADLSRPPGDDGLFGPRSAAWAVHGDFTAMMIGGVSALLLQMLHPGALAGVWDHSSFRDDMTGRLKGTARFIAGTTYGSTATAEALVARVRAIHDRVAGLLPDGTPYSANDPVLLTWVHVVEAYSFLQAYLRYRDPGFPGARQDGYYAEMAVLARRLGAEDVPETRSATEAYLRTMRPALVVDARTRSVAQALLDQPAASNAMAPLQHVLLQAGVDLLPRWAAKMHGLDLAMGERLAVRTGVVGAATVLRWALR